MEPEIQPAFVGNLSGISPGAITRSSVPATRQSGHAIVLLIGVYKFGKALTMLAVGITALRLIHHNVVEVFARWVTRIHLDPENRFLEHHVIPHLAQLTDARLRLVGIGAFLYMLLYSIEGVGLMGERRWAEWLTVVAGLGLIPIETYTLIHRPAIVKAALLASNLAISAYLFWHVRRKLEMKRISSECAGGTCE